MQEQHESRAPRTSSRKTKSQQQKSQQRKSQRRLPVVDSRMSRPESVPPRPAGFGEPKISPFTDLRGRAYTYLRLSLTDRCNMACVYCMPPGGEDEHARRHDIMSFEEASRLINVFGQGGVRRVRFTGGEPLVRKDVVNLVELTRRQTSVQEVVMTTNALRLPELAHPLAKAGLTGVNVSLDSLNPDTFRELTRGSELREVLAGIHAALDAGLKVKINAVLLGGINEGEATSLVEWAWNLGITPRFIELMPLGEASKLPAERFLSANAIEGLLGDLVIGGDRQKGGRHNGPARYLEAADGSGNKVGFITAVSEEFCSDCNRVRITAKGDLRACLADRRSVSLRDIMREGASDLDLAWAIQWSLGGKVDGHLFLDEHAEEHKNVGMSLIGG